MYHDRVLTLGEPWEFMGSRQRISLWRYRSRRNRQMTRREATRPEGRQPAMLPANPDTNLWSTTMAQKIQTLFIDDIDGGEAEGTVKFALDGTEYEIDLSARHSEELRSALNRYTSHARKVGGTARRSSTRAGRKPSAVNTVEVRNWARENGYDIKERGRVPADLVTKYQAAAGK
jgi:hypothetical protein